MAFSATLTMVLKVTRSGCSGVECIEDLQGENASNMGKTAGGKSHNFSNDDMLWGKGEMMLLFRNKWEFYHPQNVERVGNKTGPIIQELHEPQPIASKAQQFNCSRPRTCFPKDGSREQLQQSSWSCDLSFGVAFKKIYQLTVTAVTSATSSLGR